jgi:hypothetical protein
MAFQSEVGAGSLRATDTNTTPAAFAITTTHDWLTKRVNWMCSKHADTAVLNTAGSGYAVGDLIRVTHASAHFDIVLEVLTLSGSGVATFRINSNGAFALRAATAVVGAAAGSGYVVGDILEVSAGSARCPAKFEVATLSGSAVATVALVEGGGVYSTGAGTDSATVGVGNSDPTLTYAGDDACLLTVTDTAIISTLTNLATTHDTGAGDDAFTVDITLAETGWAVDGRNTNKHVINGLNNEKEVVLVGDATGITNKPYFAYRTFTETVSINEHAGIACMGLIAHNVAIDLSAHSPISLGVASETAMDTTGAFTVAMPDTGAGFGDVDLWFAADDTHFREVVQIDDTAATSDNGIYFHHYVGFLDRIGTETENPYPLYLFGATRDPTTPATTSNTNMTGLVEQRNAGNGCSFVYDSQAGDFQAVRNADGGINPGTEAWVVFPAAYVRPNDGSTGSADYIVRDSLENERAISIFGSDTGVGVTDRKIFTHGDRSTPHRIMRWLPGTVDLPFLWPLTLGNKSVASSPVATDRMIGNIKGCFWIPSDDGTGNRITNFSEDYVTVGSTRYLCFHNGSETDPQQYMAFEMNV